MKITFWNLQKKVPVRAEMIKKLARKVLQGERVKKTGWINFCFVDNQQIKKFNAKFHKTNHSTDVLAFNLNDTNENIISADIIISAQMAFKQAINYKTSPDYELSLYAVHGILHILGYGDHTPAQIKLMRKKESQYVN